MMNEKMVFETITVSDSFKKIAYENPLPNVKNVFIVCQEKLPNCQCDDISYLVKNYQVPDIPLNKVNFVMYNITADNINYLKENKKEFFIVDDLFFSKIGYKPFQESNISYFKNNSQIYLLFDYINLFMIEKKSQIIQTPELSKNNLNNNNINQIVSNNINQNNIIMNNINQNVNQNNIIMNNINQNVNNNINNKKIYILNCLIYLVANKQEIFRLLSSSDLSEKYDFTLVNKKWTDIFKNTFCYKDIKQKILSRQELKPYTFDNFKNKLQYIHSIQEIKNYILYFNDFPVNLSQQIKLYPEKKIHERFTDIIYPINFEIVNNSLFNLLNRFIHNKNDINNQYEYKIIFGYQTLYLQSIEKPREFFVYIYNKILYIFVAFIRFENDFLFQDELNKYLKNQTFVDYILVKKCDIHKFNKVQKIENLGILVLTQQLYTKNNINNNKNLNINNVLESNNNKLDYNYLLLFENYKKFNKKILSLEDRNIEDISNTIDICISANILTALPVFIIENEKFNYCLNLLNFNIYSQIEKTDEQNKKEELKRKISKPNFSLINTNFEILSLEKVNSNITYSFVDEEFCKGIKIPDEKYKPFKALLFCNKKKLFLYFENEKELFNINYNNNDNSFQLSKNEFKSSQNNNDKIPNEPASAPMNTHTLGLENIGATCYMNATLQCLCHITSLKNYFQDKNQLIKDINNKEALLTKAFDELINKLWDNPYETYYAPNNFKNLISRLNPLFQGIQANDSKDLIIFLYETLHNELNKPNTNNDYFNNLYNNNISEDLRLFRNNYYTENNSIITKIFYSEQSSYLQCKSCNIEKVSYNIINFLIFPLEKVRLYLSKKKTEGFLYVTLNDCFEQNEEKELLNGTNQIYCNNCHRQSDALSYNKLNTCPEVLTIILNRGKGLEFDVEFKCQLDINIENYVIEKNCDTNYELIGVITHLGPSSMGGHFIAYCKSPVDKKWYCYNDAQVTECADAENVINSKGIPYVLFYQRKGKLVYPKKKKENGSLTLYFKYNEKEGYLETNENEYFLNVKNQIYEKYNFIQNQEVNFYIQKSDDKLEKILDDYKTIKEYNLKDEDTIIIV